MNFIGIALQLTLVCSFASAQIPASNEGRFSVAGLEDDREVEQFFVSFREGIANRDKKKVASLVSYPIRIKLTSGAAVKVRSSADFVRLYDRIFDAKFKRIIIGTDVKNLWAKSSGVATPGGEIWINGVIKNPKRPNKYTIKVTAINRALG